MNLSVIVERLRSDNLGQVASATGVPYETLRRISTGKTPGPRITTIERIEAYYATKKRKRAA
jgi:precorrin-6x reductase